MYFVSSFESLCLRGRDVGPSLDRNRSALDEFEDFVRRQRFGEEEPLSEPAPHVPYGGQLLRSLDALGEGVDLFHRPVQAGVDVGTSSVKTASISLVAMIVPPALDLDGEILWQHDLGWSIERGIWYSPMLVYDLDGDGLSEIVVPRWNRVYWNRGGRRFEKAQFLDHPKPFWESGILSDFDGDGDMDVLSASAFDDKIAWYENDGEQNFAEHTVTDSVNRPMMALAADVAGLGVDWGYHPRQMLVAAGAHEIVSDYSDVAAAADRLLKSGGKVT